MHSGLPAVMMALEPSFSDWSYNWPRCTFLPLYKVAKLVEKAMLKALLLEYMSNKKQFPPVSWRCIDSMHKAF
jgi:hypothetical protein